MKQFNCSGLSGRIFFMIFLVCNLFQVSGQTGETQGKLSNFLFQDFSKGIVRLKTGDNYTAVLNYNIVTEEMIFDQKGTYMALLKPETLDTVFIQDRKFVPVEKAFYEVIVPGRVSLFIQHKGRLAPAGSNTAYGLKSQTLGPTGVMTIKSGNQVRDIDLPDNVIVSPASVNWIRIDGKWNKFTTERQFVKIFPDKENELKLFMKRDKIDIRVREDLFKLGKYLESIIK